MAFNWGTLLSGGIYQPGSKDKKGAQVEEYKPPPYVPSAYDKGSSEALYGFYEPRVRGEKLGFSEEDLGTMRGQAQDYSTRQMNEAIRRGGSARRAGTGGTWTGGRDVMRDEAIRGGLEYRSNAMRDIAVRNAVLKHDDQWNAATGLGNFLGNERNHALAQWTGNQQGAQQAYTYNQLYPSLINQDANNYSRGFDNQMITDLTKLAVNLFANKGSGSPSYSS